jgi:anti-sigma28 factor (negative regulator of flagellin synthesis)
MNSSNSAHLSGDPSSRQGKDTPALEMLSGESLRRVVQIEQLNLSPLAREVQYASQLLARTVGLREAKLMALRQEVESGRYCVAAEQVAEKIMADYLLDICYPSTRSRSVPSS